MRPIVHARQTVANAPTVNDGKRIVRQMTRVHFASQSKWNPFSPESDDTGSEREPVLSGFMGG